MWTTPWIQKEFRQQIWRCFNCGRKFKRRHLCRKTGVVWTVKS